MSRTYKIVLAFIITFQLIAAAVRAGGGHCSRCGCCCECQKVCRMVCEMKEITKVTWSCKCEDFCVPGPSCKTGDCCSGHCPECRDSAWVPSAAYIRTRKVPVKHEEKIKVPSYRFVVEEVCPRCAAAK